MSKQTKGHSDFLYRPAHLSLYQERLVVTVSMYKGSLGPTIGLYHQLKQEAF